MIVEKIDLDLGLKKARGVVNDCSIMEDLKAVTLFPQGNGTLYMAGSDGILTLLSRVPCEDTGDCSNKQFSAPADKILELVKFSHEKIKFHVNGGATIDISTGNANMKISKHSMDSDFIDFTVMDMPLDDFEDIIDVEEFLFILSSLIPLLKQHALDPTHSTIFMDTEKAYVFDGTTACYITFVTNRPYVIGYKSAKQVYDLLSNSSAEKVYLRYVEDDTAVLLKTESDTLKYRFIDIDMIDISVLMESNKDAVVVISKEDIKSALNLATITSEDGNVFIEISSDKVKINSKTSNGEVTEDEIQVIKYRSESSSPLKLYMHSTLFLKFCNIIKGELIIVEFDINEGKCKISDKDRRAVAVMSIGREDE